MMRRAVAIAIFVAVVAPVVVRAGLFDTDPPNVIIICLDTVRYDTFWLPDTADLSDPLKPWEMRAVRYREAQSAAPWTVPSVASVITGLYPLHHNAGRFAKKVANLDKMAPSPLAAGIATLPQVMGDYDSFALIANPFLAPQSGILRTKNLATTDSDHITKAAETVIARDSERPFFLYLHYMDAHGDAFDTPGEVKKALAGIAPALRETIRDNAPGDICAKNGNECRRYVAYAGATMRMRGYVAELLRELARYKHLDDTAVVLFSDHGEEFRDHRDEEKALHADPRGLYGSGHGQSLYQELLHVPLVVWFPQWRGMDIDTPVSLVDIAPTVASWAGTTMRTDGVELPHGATDTPQTPRVLLSSGVAYGPEQYAARIGPWKRIVRSPQDRLLFSLRRDPREKIPYRSAAAFREIDHEILQYAASAGSATIKPPELSPEILKELQSLGYLAGGQ